MAGGIIIIKYTTIKKIARSRVARACVLLSTYLICFGGCVKSGKLAD